MDMKIDVSMTDFLIELGLVKAAYLALFETLETKEDPTLDECKTAMKKAMEELDKILEVD